MAHALSITDGTTTLTLNSTNGYPVESYTPVSPTPAMAMIEPTGVDGGTVSAADWRQVTDLPMQMGIVGSSKTDLQAKINALETLLEAARRRQRFHSGPRVYIQLQLDGEANTWRSEILAARLELEADALNLWPSAATEARLNITRRYFWERTTTATAKSSTTITNNASNRLTLDSILGVIPTPAILDIRNNNGAAINFRNFYIGNDVEHGFTGTEHRVAGGTYSYGAPITHNNLVLRSDVSKTVADKCAGGYFHMLGGFSSLPAGIYVKERLFVYVGVAELAQLADGPEIVSTGQQLVDFGVWQIPPGGISASSGISFYLSAVAGGSGTITLSFLQLTPARDFLHLYNRTYNIPDGGGVVWDGGTQEVYSINAASTARYATMQHMAGGVNLYPGKSNYLYVLCDEGSGTYTDTRQLDVTVTYRPRRLTV